MRKITLLLFFVISQISFSQKKFTVDVLTGFGFNNNFTILDEKVENYSSSTTQINFNFRQNILKNLFVETGVGGQLNFSSGSIKLSKFKSTTVRLNLPITLGFTAFKKIDFTGGLVLSNNRDFDNFNQNENDNFRLSFLSKNYYPLNKKLNIVFTLMHNLSNTPNSYLVNQPSTSILLGVSYKVF